jgi:16S rRNA (cytosine967-C5)-methyltransferase
MQIDRKLMHKSSRSNMPKWLFDKLVAQMGEEKRWRWPTA